MKQKWLDGYFYEVQRNFIEINFNRTRVDHKMPKVLISSTTPFFTLGKIRFGQPESDRFFQVILMRVDIRFNWQ
jgi:hypothetical protein